MMILFVQPQFCNRILIMHLDKHLQTLCYTQLIIVTANVLTVIFATFYNIATHIAQHFNQFVESVTKKCWSTLVYAKVASNSTEFFLSFPPSNHNPQHRLHSPARFLLPFPLLCESYMGNEGRQDCKKMKTEKTAKSVGKFVMHSHIVSWQEYMFVLVWELLVLT